MGECDRCKCDLKGVKIDYGDWGVMNGHTIIKWSQRFAGEIFPNSKYKINLCSDCHALWLMTIDNFMKRKYSPISNQEEKMMKMPLDFEAYEVEMERLKEETGWTKDSGTIAPIPEVSMDLIDTSKIDVFEDEEEREKHL